MLRIRDILVENKRILGSTVGVITDEKKPSFSFQIESDRNEIKIISAKLEVNGWKEEISDIRNIVYRGKPLEPFNEYEVTVEVRDDNGEVATETAGFMTGRMSLPWKAKWITDKSLKVKSPESPQPLVFRKELFVCNEGEDCLITATAMGIFDLYLDGVRLNKDYFSPGFTDYDFHLQYDCFKVRQLKSGVHELMAVVAPGWAVGRSTHIANTNKSKSLITTERPAFLAEIRMKNQGKDVVVSTDEGFEVTKDGPYVFADFYDGEIYDANRNLQKAQWKKADVTSLKYTPKIQACYGEKVLPKETFEPVYVGESEEGELIYDIGQNISGVVSFSMNGTKGQEIVIRHSEALDGEKLYVQNLRSAKQEIRYIAKDGMQFYEPRFSYMGFRYIGVKGIEASNITLKATALYSDLDVIGSFFCSDELLNKLQKNLVWSGKDNFVDIPTDCPQRDERQGWTGDISLFANTACFNFRMDRFLMKWLRDMKVEQTKFGAIPFVIPERKGITPKITNACWGDSCILVPYALYRSTGNKKVLKEMYPVMKKHLNNVGRWSALGVWKYKSPYIFALPFQFGDWCAPYGNIKDWLGKGPWVGTAYYCYACKKMSEIALALDNLEDAYKYKLKATKIADAFEKTFLNKDGSLKDEFQTGYVLPLYFEMVDEKKRKVMAKQLLKLVKENGGHLNTGFTATPYILFALADNGFEEEAYELLKKTDHPSWLYQVCHGATTIWETWDVIQEDGSIKESSMNHYAYGAVGDFFYRRICGLEELSPGYERFQVKPMVGKGLTFAACTHESPYGTIEVKWEQKEELCIWVTVPVGTVCDVVFPNGNKKTLNNGKYKILQNE